MVRRGMLLAHLVELVRFERQPERGGEVVDRDEVLDLGLGLVVEPVVRLVHVGPQGVAAELAGTTQRSTEPSDGISRHETSLCQMFS